MHQYAIGVIAVSWLFWLWETYLDYRQYRVYVTTDKVPKELKNKFDNETFKKAKSYSIDKAKFGFITGIYGQIQSTIMIYYYLLPFFWDLSHTIMTTHFGFSQSATVEWEIYQSIIFTFITSVASTLANLPVSIYETFVLEQRHGFNKQTAGFFAWDKLKAFMVNFVIVTPLTAAIVYIVRNGGPYFFLYLWVFFLLVVCLLTFFHGEIAALFDTFTPLSEGKLREKIEKLAQSVNFPLTNIFVVEGSKRSAHSNAYQSGIFNKKRIVIYDTLIEGYNDKKDVKTDGESTKDTSDKKKKKTGCSESEILAVLCHELGHWYRSHLIKNLVFIEVDCFIIFAIFSRLYQNPDFFAAFGFNEEMPVVIGMILCMTVLTPGQEVLGFIRTVMSRHFEYEADEFAKEMGHTDKLKSALVKLNLDNLGFPVHDELYSKFNHSHPTLMQRLKALSKSD